MHVVLVAEDIITFNTYNNLVGITLVKGHDDIHNLDAVSYKTQLYKKMVSKRPFYLLEHISKMRNTIYTDIDTVWMADPRPFLTGDMWMSMDGKGYYCTGFIACKDTYATIAF